MVTPTLCLGRLLCLPELGDGGIPLLEGQLLDSRVVLQLVELEGVVSSKAVVLGGTGSSLLARGSLLGGELLLGSELLLGGDLDAILALLPQLGDGLLAILLIRDLLDG